LSVEATVSWRESSVAGYAGAVFFFQAEDGIRDRTVTGVQTCALPIFDRDDAPLVVIINKGRVVAVDTPDNLTARLRGSETMYIQVDANGLDASGALRREIGRASCRERVYVREDAGTVTAGKRGAILVQ